MTHLDLFGQPVRRLKGNGYAGSPGKGPHGETCYTCNHVRRRELSKRNVYKCGHQLGRISGCDATDIACGAPACEHWEGRT